VIYFLNAINVNVGNQEMRKAVRPGLLSRKLKLEIMRLVAIYTSRAGDFFGKGFSLVDVVLAHDLEAGSFGGAAA